MPNVTASAPKAVLITGAGGYIGRILTAELAKNKTTVKTLVANDIKAVEDSARIEGVIYQTLDIRSSELEALLRQYHIDCVVHLASIVTPSPDMTREFLYDVEVVGTRRVIESCIAAGVAQLIVTSSGAAYGYWSDNPDWLDESCPLRGNEVFAYSFHKRIVEEMLAEFRTKHPELKQLIFRVCTILGKTARNQITALFEKPLVPGVCGSASPFVLVWDQDVVGAILKGIETSASGLYNLAGDESLGLREIARILGKPYMPLPAWLLTGALFVLKKLGMTRYGPEQVGFLRYRPVLSNRRLKMEFGYIPQKTTRETFEYYISSRSA